MARINRRAVYDKMDGRCGYCGRFISYEEMQVDHVAEEFGLARAYEWGGVFYFEERHGRKKK